MFDFVEDTLPKQQLDELRFYNKRSFAVFDKYLVLREVNNELNEQMSQLVIGFSKYADMKNLLVKGAEKAYEDAYKKFQSCRGIEVIYEQPEKVSDFFEIVYEKFEKEIDGFFDSRFGDV